MLMSAGAGYANSSRCGYCRAIGPGQTKRELPVSPSFVTSQGSIIQGGTVFRHPISLSPLTHANGNRLRLTDPVGTANQATPTMPSQNP